MELREEIGLRFKQARLDKHMTQQEVAEKLGMVQTSYIRYEKGKVELDYGKVVFLCKLFDITPNELYEFTNNI